MNILIINTSGQLSSDGSRLISAILKKAGYRVSVVFLSRIAPLEYEPTELKDLKEILSGADLVLLAVYSFYALRALQVTNYIHKNFPGLPVVWGGPHCISVPELALKYADGVCFSEGDQAVLDLVRSMEQRSDYLETPNMAFRVNGQIKINQVLPPFTDLDSLPHYDYDLETHFILDHGLHSLTPEMFKKRSAGYPYYVPVFYMISSRGCPHNCSFCNNCRYLAMFGRHPLRFHSIDRILEELETVLNRFDFFQLVGFGDDDFFMRSKQEIREFAEKYKKRIGLPFGVALSANTYNREKLDLLMNAGLKVVEMGVQSGSQRVLKEVYNRNIDVSRTKDVIQDLAPILKNKAFDLLLDFIIDNPFEEPDDIIQTYYCLLELPREARINFFYLSFFPGTPIYSRGLQEGFIEPFSETGFRFFTRGKVRYQKNYEMFLVLFFRYRKRNRLWQTLTPPMLLQIMGRKWVRRLTNLCPAGFYSRLIEKIQ